jgi:hypothetical protein
VVRNLYLVAPFKTLIPVLKQDFVS